MKEELKAKDLYAYMVENFPDYPCKECKRNDKFHCDIGGRENECQAYKLWFSDTWKRIRKYFGKE